MRIDILSAICFYTLHIAPWFDIDECSRLNKRQTGSNERGESRRIGMNGKRECRHRDKKL